MKYGLIVYINTDNIGDDILSYAASQFLPSIDYVIDRESLDTFMPIKKEYVNVIMNGWYLYHKSHWPPSPFLNPLLVGIHFTDNLQEGIGDEYLNGLGKDFLKKNQPIGCRDFFTLEKMKQRNILAYFSGCLTLTLDKFPNIEKRKKIILVDVPRSIQEIVIKKTNKDRVEIITHNIDEKKRGKDWNERRIRVEELLKKYQGAELVLTTRLHCALPCLALETPVLLIEGDNDDVRARMQTYEVYLHHCSVQEFVEGKVDLKKISANPDSYKKVRSSLCKVCSDFIQNASIEKNIPILPETESFEKLWRNKTLWQRQLQRKDRISCNRDFLEELKKSNEWQKDQIITKEERIKELEKYIAELIDSKNYLEQQEKNKNNRIQEMDKGIIELKTGKQYLENQLKNKDERIKELHNWILELEAGKEWLENKTKEQEKYISVLKNERKSNE